MSAKNENNEYLSGFEKQMKKEEEDRKRIGHCKPWRRPIIEGVNKPIRTLSRQKVYTIKGKKYVMKLLPEEAIVLRARSKL